MVAKAIALCAMLVLTACSTTGGSFCDLAKPIRLTPKQIEVLDDVQVNEMLGHLERGQQECGWRP